MAPQEVVLHAGVLHAYFEAIHPFLDGNGRVGRMLIPLYLYARGQLETPAFYLSDYIERRRDTYYDRLESVTREGTFTSWLHFLSTRLRRRLSTTCNGSGGSRSFTPRSGRASPARSTRRARPVSPIFTAVQVRKLSGASRAVAHRALSALEDDGTIRITRPGSGRIPSLWFYAELFEIVK